MRMRRDGHPDQDPRAARQMRAAGLVVARTLAVLADAVRPGITTAELDAIAEREIGAAGAAPSSSATTGIPRLICTSVNEQIVHGIPNPGSGCEPGTPSPSTAARSSTAGMGTPRSSVGSGRSRPATGAARHCARRMWAGSRRGTETGWRISPMRSSGLSRPTGGYGIMRSTPAMASGPRCTWTRQSQLRPGRSGAAAPRRDGAGDRADDHPWRRAHRRACRRLDGRELDGSRAAHFEHTVAITAAGPWVLTDLDVRTVRCLLRRTGTFRTAVSVTGGDRDAG